MSDHILTARAVIIYDGKLLVVKHANNHSTHYAFPGGKMEGSESISESIHRELKEELNIDAQSGDIIAVHEFEHPVFGGRRIEFFFHIDNPQNFAHLPDSHQAGSHAFELSEIVWIPLTKLDQYDIRPHSIRDKIGEENTKIYHSSL